MADGAAIGLRRAGSLPGSAGSADVACAREHRSTQEGGATFRTPTPTSARLIVELPANAKLFVDDQPMKTTSSRRAFRTPTLEPGQSYYYMLRAELVHDGKTVQQTKKVVVRAGEEIRANFPNLEQIQTAEIGAQAKR